MNFVIDTNILFSFFWKNSFTQKLFSSPKFKLISPVFALEELKKYSTLIIRKTKSNRDLFNKRFKELRSVVEFVDEKNYSKFFKEAKKISPDEGDIHFFALCLNSNCVLWSNDKILKNQKLIQVLSTEEIVELLFG